MSTPSSTSSSLKSKPTAGADDEKKSSTKPGHISGNNMILRFSMCFCCVSYSNLYDELVYIS